MKNPVVKKIFQGAFIVVLIGLMALLYYIIAKDIGVDFIHQIMDKDYAGAKEQLRDLGVKGAFCIIGIEMLQMLVVFAPQEFIMICAGLAFPWYLAIPICVAGIFLGSSLIFVIVRILHLRLETLEKGENKINSFIKHLNKKTSITLIVCLMFIMPILPVGAIVYFAASSKISYKRFALVCTAGIIPDVAFAYLIGHVMYDRLGTGEFISALVIIILLTLLLLYIVINLIKIFFFRKEVEKPNGLLYHVVFFFINLYMKKFKTVKKHVDKPKRKRPFIVIGTHTSFYDFYFVAKAVYPRRLNVVTNKFYTQHKSTRKILKLFNVIPKKLFTVDTETARGLLLAKDNKCNIAIFPEGRLSSSGASFPYAENIASLVKKLGIDVYFYHTVGGYYAYPKWRKTICSNPVEIYLEKMFTAEELSALSKDEINSKISQKLVYDDCKRYMTVATQGATGGAHTSVLGLENVIFHCPSCGADYTLSTTETTMSCSSCGKEFAFNDRYVTEGMTISDMYSQQAEYLKALPLQISDTCDVYKLDKSTRLMTKVGEGDVEIKDDKIIFNGKVLSENVVMEHTPESLPALAFSCNEQFEFYHEGTLYYFYPYKKETCTKWSMIWDIIVENHRKANSK